MYLYPAQTDCQSRTTRRQSEPNRERRAPGQEGARRDWRNCSNWSNWFEAWGSASAGGELGGAPRAKLKMARTTDYEWTVGSASVGWWSARVRGQRFFWI
jgi:hypothetical protein